ncbi:MAG TPA: 2'-5' RNA ligase family protein [Terriglobia bacterium]|nr:2'-5' RNA ligase family protein [Terriglobia bacterium]
MIAIDVLLLPDALMAEAARAINTQFRGDYRQGFALDANHVPHITLVQRYVNPGDIDAIAKAVVKTAENGPAFPLTLTAKSIGAAERNDGLGVVAFELECAPSFLDLAGRIAEAVQPFAVRGGSADAFARADGPEIDIATVRYVEDFVDASAGPRYSPHLTLGVARRNFVRDLENAPFKPFTFSGVDVAIYQLGNLGAAQRELWAWKRVPAR